jgi:nucleotide-binding universal stress UspA family protein
MKNVIVLIHDDAGQEARLQAALDLARALSGHLSCLDVTPLPVMPDLVWGGASAALIYDETERESANAKRVRERLAAEDVSWSWKELRGDFTACLSDAMRTADIVVLNRALEGLPAPQMPRVIGNLVMRNEAVVAAVSPEATGFAVAAPALVAWDGSGTAMRAMQRAVPLLALANSVVLVQVGTPEDQAIAADEAASYLARHEIKPEIELLPESTNVAAIISSAAARIGAGFCVMGAFGHGRLREALFGGVTRDMLRSDGVPLVLFH